MERDFKRKFPTYPSALHTALTGFNTEGKILGVPGEINLQMYELFRPFNAEVSEVIQEYQVMTLDALRFRITGHVNSMFYCVEKDTNYALLPETDKNLILWVVLLHDISKRKFPDNSRDPFHPFASAATAIEVLYKLQWFPARVTEEQVQAAAQYIRGAVRLHEEKEIHDNSKLPEILSKLYYLCGMLETEEEGWSNYTELEERGRGDWFLLELLLCILFHQSVSVVGKYPGEAGLTPEEITTYYSLRLLQLLRIVVFNDSFAYKHALKDPMEFGGEIIAKLDWVERLLRGQGLSD